MASVTPNSDIRILKGVPFNSTYRDTTKFSTVQAQTDYFISKTFKQFNNCTYVRESNSIRVEVNADMVHECNYLMYRNTNFTNKWFYAFINKITYISNVVCEIQFEIDVMQTYQFEFDILDTFVEREHVTDDSIGANLIDENLSLGDYVTVARTTKFFTQWWIVVGATVDIRETVNFPSLGGYVYGGIYSGVSYFCFDMNSWNTGSMLPSLIQALASQGKADAIVSMYMIPKDCVSSAQSDGGFLQPTVMSPQVLSVVNNQTLDGYKPRNKKLLTYPYRGLMISNQEGSAITLKFEFFNGEPKLEYRSGMQANCKIVLYPKDYKGVFSNYSESISLGSFPQCAWIKDVYANWLATQTIRNEYTEKNFYRNAAFNIFSGGVGGAEKGGSLGASVGVVSSGVGTIQEQMNMYSAMAEEKEVMSLVPNSVSGSIGNGSTNISIGTYGFVAETRTIKSEVAKSIDGYFDIYGYKVNKVKKPNINTRPYWNYVKTIGAKIKGELSNEDMLKVCTILDSGITFWKSPSNVGNYSLNNSI